MKRLLTFSIVALATAAAWGQITPEPTRAIGPPDQAPFPVRLLTNGELEALIAWHEYHASELERALNARNNR